MVRGRGKYQKDKAEESLMAIYRVLSDGKKHRHKEIKEKTGLNDPTLKKYFDRLLQQKIIKKEIDVESGVYPYPAYYSIVPVGIPIIKIILTIEQEKREIEKIILDPEKTPLDVLDQINHKNNSLILNALRMYKEDRNIPHGLFNSLLELTVWNSYRVLTSSLIESSQKVIEKIDVEKLIEQNKASICIDLNALKRVGFTENQIKELREKWYG